MRGNVSTRWLRVFPRTWRNRYEDELAALIEDLEHDDDLRAVDRLDIMRAGLQARARGPHRRATILATTGAATLASTLGALTLAGVLTSSPRPAADVPSRSTPRRERSSGSEETAALSRDESPEPSHCSSRTPPKGHRARPGRRHDEEARRLAAPRFSWRGSRRSVRGDPYHEGPLPPAACHPRHQY